MKRFTILLLLGIILISCDKRKDLFNEINEASKVELILNNSHSSFSSIHVSNLEVIDTVKVSRYYKFTLKINDESDVVDMKFTGPGTMYMDGSVIGTDYFETPVGTHLFEWMADTLGQRDIMVSVKDKYDVVTDVKLHLNVFYNKLPNITWAVVHVGNVSPYEKKIVVSGNDGDWAYGGSINYYEYVINQDTTYFTGNQMYYVFPSAGSYLISVRAKDNDSEWSNPYVISNYVIQ